MSDVLIIEEADGTRRHLNSAEIAENKRIAAATPSLRSILIASIKEIANKLIVTKLPEHTQRNMIARAVQLQRKELKALRMKIDDLTADEEAELDVIENAFDSIVKPIRDASKIKCSEVAKLPEKDLATYNIQEGW